jgi:hypothetical protein
LNLVRPLIKVNQLQRHVCSNIFLPYDIFYFNEKYYFPYIS